MIIDARMTIRFSVAKEQLESRRAELESEAIKHLRKAAADVGANPKDIHAVVFATSHETDPSQVYMNARFTAPDVAEIVGGAHDGAQFPVRADADRLRVALDENSSDAPLDDDNSRWYKRAGISDQTGLWAFIPDQGNAFGDG